MPKRPAEPKSLRDRPIYLTVREMIDPESGELVGVLAPDSYADQLLMRERKYRRNEVLRATLIHPRTSAQHRRVHYLGTLVKNNVDGFQGMDSHAVIKRLQAEAGVFCEIHKIQASPILSVFMKIARTVLGGRIAAKLEKALPPVLDMDVLVPQSIAYDCMDESEFRVLWHGICAHLVERYWPGLTTEQITEMAAMLPQSEGI